METVYASLLVGIFLSLRLFSSFVSCVIVCYTLKLCGLTPNVACVGEHQPLSASLGFFCTFSVDYFVCIYLVLSLVFLCALYYICLYDVVICPGFDLACKPHLSAMFVLVCFSF